MSDSKACRTNIDNICDAFYTIIARKDEQPRRCETFSNITNVLCFCNLRPVVACQVYCESPIEASKKLDNIPTFENQGTCKRTQGQINICTNTWFVHPQIFFHATRLCTIPNDKRPEQCFASIAKDELTMPKEPFNFVMLKVVRTQAY